MPTGAGIPLDDAIPMLADALAYNDEADVRRWFERYERMTGHAPLVYQSTIDDCRTFKKVPNDPFRGPFLHLSDPLILGRPVKHRDYAPALTVEQPWVSLFREELLKVRERTDVICGPSNLGCRQITGYLNIALGVRGHKNRHRDGTTGIALAWLLNYEVAEALCKTLGLVPYQVGI